MIDNLLAPHISQINQGEKTTRNQSLGNDRPKEKRLVLEPKRYNRSILMMGCVLPPLGLRESIHYRLLRDMLTGGMNSPLQVEIRERRGLAYNLSLQLLLYQDVSLLIFTVMTQFRHMSEIESIFWHEIDSVIANQARFAEVKHMLKQTILHREYTVASLNDEAIDSYLDFERVVPVKEIIAEIENATIQDVVNTISSCLKPETFAYIWVDCHETETSR